jgi:hypothetical protein
LIEFGAEFEELMEKDGFFLIPQKMITIEDDFRYYSKEFILLLVDQTLIHHTRKVELHDSFHHFLIDVLYFSAVQFLNSAYHLLSR